jgi:CRP-like cAMP-binding protein
VSGYLSFRKYDNATIVAYIYPPMITNLGGLFVNSNAGFVRAESPVLVRRITRGNLFYCLENHPSLWRNVTLIMAYGFQRLLIRDTQINQKNAYYIVRNLLMDLNDQPEKIRNTVSAARYILDRAPLSRSTVMHILSELQRGKYVVMAKGGYLVAINKLPEQF